ncbi:Ribosome biogenesis protein nsa1 (NOP7-associated protein 1) [Dimargaris xerosporica]|nr:Ribosome biogenesis protein nsa1 (NOP7-associated protein 1) [Dimargaris xerosporica]
MPQLTFYNPKPKPEEPKCLGRQSVYRPIQDDVNDQLQTKVGITAKHLRYGAKPRSVTTDHDVQPVVKTWETQTDRTRGIDAMAYLADPDSNERARQQYMVVGRRNGDLEVVPTAWGLGDSTDGTSAPSSSTPQTQAYYRTHVDCFAENQTLPRGKQATDGHKFIGVGGSLDGSLIACTTRGNFTIQRFSPEALSSSTDQATMSDSASAIRIDFGTHLRRMRIHPRLQHLVAVVGWERQLMVWDVNSLRSHASSHDVQIWIKPTVAPTFQAHNVPNDELDLPIPYKANDVQFLSDDGTQLVVGTAQRQLRVYDTRAQQAPVQSYEAGNDAISCIATIPGNSHQIYIGSNIGLILAIDLRMGRSTASYKGATGSISTMTVSERYPQYLVAASLDRHLRVYNVAKQPYPLLHTLYLKQRLSSLLLADHVPWDECEPAPTAPNSKSSDDDQDDTLWDQMTPAGDQGRPTKRSKVDSE